MYVESQLQGERVRLREGDLSSSGSLPSMAAMVTLGQAEAFVHLGLPDGQESKHVGHLPRPSAGRSSWDTN